MHQDNHAAKDRPPNCPETHGHCCYSWQARLPSCCSNLPKCTQADRELWSAAASTPWPSDATRAVLSVRPPPSTARAPPVSARRVKAAPGLAAARSLTVAYKWQSRWEYSMRPFTSHTVNSSYQAASLSSQNEDRSCWLLRDFRQVTSSSKPKIPPNWNKSQCRSVLWSILK